MKHRPYPALLLKLKEQYTKLQNAEMVAILTAAEYEHMTLTKICNTKMTNVCPSLASEAITTVDSIAEKVEKNLEIEDEQTAE